MLVVAVAVMGTSEKMKKELAKLRINESANQRISESTKLRTGEAYNERSE